MRRIPLPYWPSLPAGRDTVTRRGPALKGPRCVRRSSAPGTGRAGRRAGAASARAARTVTACDATARGLTAAAADRRQRGPGARARRRRRGRAGAGMEDGVAGPRLGEAAQAAEAAGARPALTLRPFAPFPGVAEADESGGDWSFIDCEMEEVDLQDLPSATIACHLDPRVFVDGLCRVRAGPRGPSGGGRTPVAPRRRRGLQRRGLQPGPPAGRGGDPRGRGDLPRSPPVPVGRGRPPRGYRVPERLPGRARSRPRGVRAPGF